MSYSRREPDVDVDVDRSADVPTIGHWILYFVVGAVALMGFVLLVLWASTGFQRLGIGTVGLVALIIGSVLTAALGIALMGLVFYSDRSGADELVHRTSERRSAQSGERVISPAERQ